MPTNDKQTIDCDVSYRTSSNILVLTITVSTLLLVVGLGGAWYVHWVNNDASVVLDSTLAAAIATERVDFSIRDVRLDLASLAEKGELSDLDAADASLRQVETLFAEYAQQEIAEGRGEEFGFGTIPASATRFARLLAELRHRNPEEMRREAGQLVAQLNRTLLDPVEQLLEDRQHAAQAASDHNKEVSRGVGLGLLLLGVCGAMAGLLAGFGIARNVHRSMLQISLPVRDMAGRLNEVVGPINVTTNTDLSELDDVLRTLADKTADVVRHLQDSQKQSLRNEQLAAVGRLAAGLAHELRNPLMSMKLIVQTAAERCRGQSPVSVSPEEPCCPDSRDADATCDHLLPRDLTVLEEEIVRLEKMLQMFLDFARPPRPEKHRVDVGLVIDCTLDFIRPRAERQGVTLHGPSLDDPLWILADESQMRQVLLNLLLNALDALPGGGNVWVQVALGGHLPSAKGSESVAHPYEPTRPPGANGDVADVGSPHVEIRVADDGKGLSVEDAERIFDPFVSTKPMGIGLGLSICRRIVESHEGEITVRNRPAGGAEFTIQLPPHALYREPTTTAIAPAIPPHLPPAHD